MSKRKYLLALFLVGTLLFCAFYFGKLTANSSPDEIILSPNYSFWKAFNFIVGKVGSTYYAISGTTGEYLSSGTNDDPVIQYAIDTATVSGGSIGIRTATYNASITMKDNVRLVIEKGATGITVSINAGATCIIEDYNAGRTRYYNSGSLSMDVNQATGKITTAYGNYTATLYCVQINEISSGKGVQILKLIIENGTSFPTSPNPNQLFLRTDLDTLYAFNGSSWVSVGIRDYANLTGTPDLTVYLLTDGSRPLTANWNVGTYGIYGATWFNATLIDANTWYWNSENRTDTLAYPEQSISYIVFQDGTETKMKNCTSGQVDASSTNSSQIFNWAIGNSSDYSKIMAKGTFTIATKILLNDKITLDFYGATFELGYNGSIFETSTTDPDNHEDIKILGGYYNGNAATYNGSCFSLYCADFVMCDVNVYDFNMYGLVLSSGSGIANNYLIDSSCFNRIRACGIFVNGSSSYSVGMPRIINSYFHGKVWAVGNSTAPAIKVVHGMQLECVNTGFENYMTSIVLEDTATSKIIDCQLDSVGNGIELITQHTTGVKGLLIMGNTFFIGSSALCYYNATANSIWHDPNSAVQLHDLSIIGNIFPSHAIGTEGYASDINFTRNNPYNILIKDNIFYSIQNSSQHPIDIPVIQSNVIICNNIGYNKVGLIAEPFGTSINNGKISDFWRLDKSDANPTNNTVYYVTGIDCFINATGGSGTINITVWDNNNNQIFTGATSLQMLFLPVGYKICFTVSTGGSLPTVKVYGN